jgi:hypothetical protein
MAPGPFLGWLGLEAGQDHLCVRAEGSVVGERGVERCLASAEMAQRVRVIDVCNALISSSWQMIWLINESKSAIFAYFLRA